MLRPIKGNKMQLNWAGPFRIISKMNEVNYIIQEEGEDGRQVVHVNMIKPYYRKEKVVLFAMKEGDNKKHELPYWEGRGEPQYNPEDVKICDMLTPE